LLKATLSILLLIAIPASGADLDGLSVVFGKPDSLEAHLEMKFTQRECSVAEPFAAPKIDVSRSNYKFIVKITAGMNCNSTAGDPKIGFSRYGMTIGVKSIFPDDSVALCVCGREMKFEFDLTFLKEDFGSGYVLKKLFFVMDEAVVGGADIPRGNDTHSQ
jgi:hypothetical protein